MDFLSWAVFTLENQEQGSATRRSDRGTRPSVEKIIKTGQNVQFSIKSTGYHLNHTWGSGGISSMWRFPVSSTFWKEKWYQSPNYHDHRWSLVQIIMTLSTWSGSHLSSFWLRRKDKTSLSCSLAAIKLKYLPPKKKKIDQVTLRLRDLCLLT